LGVGLFAQTAQAGLIKIGALVSAQVEEVAVKEGDQIEAGQLLIKLDTSLYQAHFAKAKAELEYQMALMSEKEKRYQEAKFLYEDTVTAKREFEGYERDFLAAKAMTEKAKADVDFWRAKEKYYVIRAPRSGSVSRLLVEQGSSVFNENTPMIELSVEDEK
jgi:multidrug resistance efflux pump